MVNVIKTGGLGHRGPRRPAGGQEARRCRRKCAMGPPGRGLTPHHSGGCGAGHRQPTRAAICLRPSLPSFSRSASSVRDTGPPKPATLRSRSSCSRHTGLRRIVWPARRPGRSVPVPTRRCGTGCEGEPRPRRDSGGSFPGSDTGTVTVSRIQRRLEEEKMDVGLRRLSNLSDDLGAGRGGNRMVEPESLVKITESGKLHDYITRKRRKPRT